MKKKVAFFSLFCLLSIAQHVIAQDPYSRLQQAANGQAAIRKQLTTKQITSASPHWKLNRLPAITYKPFEMVDQNGKAIKPTDMLTMANGSIMNAQLFFQKLNDLEKKFNEQGYSLRNNQDVTISKMELPKQYYDDKVNSFPKAIKALRSADEKNKAGSLQISIGNIEIKPDSRYTPSEKKALEGIAFEGSGSVANVTVKKTDLSAIKTSPRPVTTASTGTGNLLKSINETETKEWDLGDPNIMEAGFNGEITRQAEIYDFDPQRPGNCMSQFRITATGTVFGTLLNNSIDIFSAKADFFAPHDSARNMTASFDVKVGGISIYNPQESFKQEKTYIDFKGRSVDESFGLTVPIGLGIDFTGKIGIKGSAGLDYRASVGRGFVYADISPIVKIEGYAEAGVDFLSVIGGGVDCNLDFLTANLDMQGTIYLGPLVNPTSIFVYYQHYFGYDLKMLDGKISCYVKVCVPHIHCWRPITHELFSWKGIQSSGTISDDTKILNLSNL